MRMLAQRSAAAAKEFKELINDSVSKAEDGVRLVKEASASGDEIVTAVKRVTDIMSELSLASQEQRSGVEQDNQIVMNEVSQQNATLLQEAAAAESTHEQGHQLTQAEGTFKLSDATSSNITVTPVKRSNRPSSVAQLHGTATKETVRTMVNSAANSAFASVQARKIATGGGNDWEEF